MFNVRKHPSLWLILTALFVTVCRCSTGQQAPGQTTSDGVTIPNCWYYIDTSTGNGIFPGKGITCSIECPRGPGSVIRDFYISDESKIRLGDMTYEQLKQQACLAGEEGAVLVPVAQNSSTSASNETSPTEPPTEEPAATEPPVESAPLQPLLKGTVSACDTAQGFINFPLAVSNPDLAGKTLGVTINGKAVNCGIPAVNTSVLACPMPPGTVFPITVSVTLAGVEVNNFSNDGYFCTNTSSSTGSEDTTEEEPVAPLTCIPDPDNPYSCQP